MIEKPGPTRQKEHPEKSDILLDVRDLKTQFTVDEGITRAVDGVSFELRRGMTLGVVGESGCGKSILAQSIMRLVRPPGRITNGQALYHRQKPTKEHNGDSEPVDLIALEPDGSTIRSIRGNEITMIFQEPMVSMSPVHTIGDQITEVFRLHTGVSKGEARDRCIDVLARVGIPNPQRRIDDYPFVLSGGMRQRCMIAMAIITNPALLIADEPTTALDVTTQAQILELLRELQSELGMALLLITHDLGIMAQVADEVMVMYLGKVVEHADVHTLFRDPKHPYTQELLKSIPTVSQTDSAERLVSIKGNVPPGYLIPPGCSFHPRCPQVIGGVCASTEPQLLKLSPRQSARCLLYSDQTDERQSAGNEQ